MRAFFVLSFFMAMAVNAQVETAFPLRGDGSIIAWNVAGPVAMPAVLSHGEQCAGFFKDYLEQAGGEAGCVPVAGATFEAEGRDIAWRTTFSTPSGLLDYNEIFQPLSDFSGVAYAYCSLSSDREQAVFLKVRSNDGVRVWLGSERVHEYHAGRTIGAMEDSVAVTLHAGANRLLAKVDQSGGAWGLQVRLAGANGEAPAGVQSGISSIEPLKPGISDFSLTASPFVRKTAQGERQVIYALITSGGVEGLQCSLEKDGWGAPVLTALGNLPAGQHRVELLVPVISGSGLARATLSAAGMTECSAQLELSAPRRWSIDLVQHVHTDIGYTRPQTEILPEHLRYIDYALDFCDLTDDYPDDAKFRWTCETSWAVREYLKCRPPEQIERLKRRIAEGRIEVTAMFLNMSEIATESSLGASLTPLRELRERLGATISLGMQDDVNGAAWCLVDYFAPLGVKYLTMGVNKTRSLLPFDRPTPFWWESPSGNRILAFRADHYNTGNFWRIHDGDMAAFQQGLLGYLGQLEKVQYPFDQVLAQYSGYFTDNSPPAYKQCELIRDWNERYVWPKLRSATASEFMREIEEKHGKDLPVYRQAWPDWWTDGFGSAARETAASRETHAAMQASQSLLAMAVMFGASLSPGLSERLQAVQEKLLFYDEHTYGAAESISDPLVENSMVQWAEKGAYAWEAVKEAAMIREEALGTLQDFVPRGTTPSIAVFNTLNWPRTGLVEVFIDHGILPNDGRGRIVDAATGAIVPAQALRNRTEGTWWGLWVSDIPALGFKNFRIELEGVAAPQVEPSNSGGPVLENAFYRLEVDPQSGGIARLLEKRGGRELVDSHAAWRVGQVLREQLRTREDMSPEHIQRTSLSKVAVSFGEGGPIWKSIQVHGQLPGTAGDDGVRAEFRLYETEPRVDLLYSVRKLPVTDPEALYVAFPFDSPGGQLWYEAQGGLVRPGIDQLENSSSDWHTVQNFVALRAKDSQLILGSVGAPLMQFGGLNIGKWQMHTDTTTPHFYSWVMNNYWFTNFRASQEGEFRWHYYLMAAPGTSNLDASRFGWGSSIPLVARVLPPGKKEAAASRSAWCFDAPNLMLIDARPSSAGGGVMLQLREVEGKEAKVSSAAASTPAWQTQEVDVLGQPLGAPGSCIAWKPYASKFLLLKK